MTPEAMYKRCYHDWEPSSFTPNVIGYHRSRNLIWEVSVGNVLGHKLYSIIVVDLLTKKRLPHLGGIFDTKEELSDHEDYLISIAQDGQEK